MARLFFRLRMVPEDEADDVRQLLDDHYIPWFETSAGRWGVSFPALWLSDEDDMPRASELLEAYQQQRLERIREQNDGAGNPEKETVFSRFLDRPVQGLAIMIIVAVIIYFSIKPFFSILSA